MKSLSLRHLSASTADSDDMVEVKPAITLEKMKLNAMLIGACNVGKHALVNSLFPEDDAFDSSPLK